MKTHTFISVFAALALSSTLYAANNIPNGQPFQALDALIEENTQQIANNAALIAENSDAISSNALSIDALEAQAAQTANALASLESRVTANEGNIASILSDLNTINGDITSLGANLLTLSANISISISSIENEIVIIKASIVDLTNGLDDLKAIVATKVDELNSAISVNSSDIGVLSAIVTSMNADLTVGLADIASLNARVTAAETNLDSQEISLSAINSHLDLLDVQVSTLQGLHTREFTIVDNPNVEDITNAQFIDKITALNYVSGEWFYIAVGENEFCSSNAEIASMLSKYTEGVNYTGYSNTDSYINTGNGWASTTYTFKSSYWYADNSYIHFNVNSSNDNLNIAITPDYYSYGEVYLNGVWNDYTATVRVGSSRLGTCGF